MGWEKEVIIGCVILLVIITIIIAVIFIKKNPSPNNNILETYKREDKISQTDSFDGSFFYIHNHLNKTIRVKCSYLNYSVDIADIPPLSKKGLNEKAASQIFTVFEGYRPKINVYTLDIGLTPHYPSVENFYAEYKMKTPYDTMIKALHIGMVTSKVLGERLEEDVIAVGSAQGRGRVYIHNLSSRPLRLNYNIRIPPYNTLIYYGQNFIGVNLGTVFKDQDGFYEDFIYKMPATDIIYGLSSDTEFPKFSGFENDIKGLLNIPHEPMWMLIEGFQGGPAFSRVDPFFIPTEGREINPVDQWGRNINNPELIKEDLYLDNRKPYKLPGNLHIVSS